MDEAGPWGEWVAEPVRYRLVPVVRVVYAGSPIAAPRDDGQGYSYYWGADGVPRRGDWVWAPVEDRWDVVSAVVVGLGRGARSTGVPLKTIEQRLRWSDEDPDQASNPAPP